jgi:hypothetical protein
MAYSGSTAASSVANPPRCLFAGMWGQRSTSVIGSSKVRGQNVWLYNTTDSCTDLVTASYFSDGFYLGMKEGDLILGSFTTGSTVSAYLGVIGPVTTAGCAIASSGGQIRTQ